MTVASGTILVVEDDRHLRDAVVSTLATAGYGVLEAGDGSAALDVLDAHAVDLVLTDVEMRPVNGRELLERVRTTRPGLPVLMMTAYGTIEQAVAAMRDGAVDYLVKPFEADELERRVARFVAAARAALAEGAAATAAAGDAVPGSARAVALGAADFDAAPDGAAAADGRDERGPIAADPRSRELRELAERVAASEVTVLLTGESGTGKEVFARHIHASSKRSAGPFVAVNCAAIPEQMLEALLFGHEKGAFTGAQSRSDGKFVQANGGTLLLDEITEMHLGLQAKLLRVLQEREVEPLGASRPVPLDVRVLATSNRDLEQTVRAGQFREDLFYRLSVFPLRIPALRERPADIAALARRFLLARAGRDCRLSAAALAALAGHDWPGNVRELENVIQRALVLAGGAATIEPQHLVLGGGGCGGGAMKLGGAAAASAAGGAMLPALAEELWEEETRRIVTALKTHHGGRKRAAQQLGISDRTLRYKLAKMRAAGIEVPGDRSAGAAV